MMNPLRLMIAVDLVVDPVLIHVQALVEDHLPEGVQVAAIVVCKNVGGVMEHVILVALLDVVEDVEVLVQLDARVLVQGVVQGVAELYVLVHVVEDLFMIINNIKDLLSGWRNDNGKHITFIVTKDCQLACKYCYLVGKNKKERMSWQTVKSAIDYILDHEEDFREESVVWDFIGGEPFLEIELIDRICDYLKTEMYRRNHHWFDSYRFNFSTNGINYHFKEVQEFIKKNYKHLSIGITIDGTKQKHDLNRIWKGEGPEKGSYEDVVKNIPLWLSQFPKGGTKVTISSADIPHIKESVLHLYELGIHEVNINVVFEDVWNEGDDLLFEEQLIQLADAIIVNGYFQGYACSFFNETIGKPMDKELDNQNWCGAGKMLAVDAQGNFYPCTRFAAYSLRDKKPIIIGNIKDGIDQNKLRPFLILDRTTQSPQKCIECEVASGCAWCQGENYDAADTNTIYQRSTAICKMHKARVRANNYYWNKLFRKLEKTGEIKPESKPSVIC